MKTIISIAMTAIVSCLIGWKTANLFASRTASPDVRSQQQPESRSAQIAARAVPTTPADTGKSNFLWEQVESTNYWVYIQNLRNIGCPEATIRDIITADVHALFQQLRSQAQPTESIGFWNADYDCPTPLVADIARLSREEQEVLDTLLGPLSAASANGAQSAHFPGLLRLDGILEPKRALLEQWQQHFESQKNALLAITEQRDLTGAEVEIYSALEAAQDQALGALLTPAERAEFDLRNSPSARYLRQSLPGINLTEQEFRAMFEARKQFDTALASATSSEETWRALDMFDQFVASVLGSERFTQFDRARNPVYQELFGEGVPDGRGDADAIQNRQDEYDQGSSEFSAAGEG